jgi:radical SAM protein with 4Fe4S-binding SPASM domain
VPDQNKKFRSQRVLNILLRGMARIPFLRRSVTRLTRWRFLRRSAWFRRFYEQRMDYLMARNQLPEIVIIENTNHCNARCRMCPQPRMQRQKGIMPDALYRKLIDACAALGIQRVQLNATGDPLMDPGFAEKIGYAKRRGIAEVSFFTNAFLLSPEKTRQVLEAGPDIVVLSLDGYDQATYEKVRGLPFAKVRDNILYFLRQNHEQGGRVFCLISSLCVQEKPAAMKQRPLYATLLRLASKVALIPAEEMHNWSGAVPWEILGKNKITETRVPCRRLWSSFNVLWDGRVALCDMDYEGESILGDIRVQTIPEIWNAEPYRQMRAAHQARDFIAIRLCRGCREDVSWWKEHSEDQRKL